MVEVSLANPSMTPRAMSPGACRNSPPDVPLAGARFTCPAWFAAACNTSAAGWGRSRLRCGVQGQPG